MNNLDYIMALLSTEGKFSCKKASNNLTNISHDRLTRHLQKDEIEEKIDISSLPKGGRLIFDDTTINKLFKLKTKTAFKPMLKQLTIKTMGAGILSSLFPATIDKRSNFLPLTLLKTLTPLFALTLGR